MTQAELAEKLGTSQQSYARWENGKIQPPLPALRDMALLFDTTVDFLVGKGPAKPSTTRYCMLSDEADGFWGHLGLLMPRASRTRWFPITEGVSSNLRQGLGGDTPAWIVAPTLNNRMLVFRPSEFKRICLLDDACDAPEGDFDFTSPWKDSEGISMELYLAIGDWANDKICGKIDFQNHNSERLREAALALIDEGALSDRPEEVDHLIRDTVLHFTDGSTLAYRAECRDLADLIEELDSGFEPTMVKVSASGGDFESFYPARSIRMIDVPIIELNLTERASDI